MTKYLRWLSNVSISPTYWNRQIDELRIPYRLTEFLKKTRVEVCRNRQRLNAINQGRRASHQNKAKRLKNHQRIAVGEVI